MKLWRFERYCEDKKEEWNRFVKESRNATFMLDRGYVDYHSSRFSDCSWMAYKGNKLRALLPANITPDGVLHSHQGLTYGGWIIPKVHFDGADMLEMFSEAVEIWKQSGITALDYKPIPWIYHQTPSEEDIYALFRLGATLTECCISETVSLRDPLRMNETRRQILKYTADADFRIEETCDVETFMRFEELNLLNRHGVRPVHSASEMRLLRERFPENIRFFILSHAGRIQCGTCVYDTGRVAHCQYIFSTPECRSLNLLTPLHFNLIKNVFADREYYDFGTCTEKGGLYLNEGLLRHKASFGASAVNYNRYLLPLAPRP